MLSVVSICNLALAHLGDSANVISIDPPEGSAQAEHCARFYPQARNALLEMHAWNFATRREKLALLSRQDSTWTHRYAMPNQALSVLSIVPEGMSDDYEVAGRVVPAEYQVEREDGALVVLTDIPDAVMRYVSAAVDPSLYPAMFVEALSWKLAALLAGPLYKGEAGAAEAKRCEEMFAYHFAAARQQDAKQRRVTLRHIVPWLEAR